MPKPRKRKVERATVYAARQDGYWLDGYGCPVPFAQTFLYTERRVARANYPGQPVEIVPCRVTVLPSKRKARFRTK